MESVQNKIVKAALLGAGTVGSGVYELVKERQEDFPHICGTQIEIAKILVRDASKEREGIPSELLTDNWKEIIADDSISIIIEVMGGIEPAKSYLLEAMKAGKQVVTANKDLIAEHGHELLDTAEQYGCDFKFEAAVAGCVPIIQILKQSMSSENITEIMGIVNGTTNHNQQKKHKKKKKRKWYNKLYPHSHDTERLELRRSIKGSYRFRICRSRPYCRCGRFRCRT